LVFLSLLGVGYQGWKEAKRMQPPPTGGLAADLRLRRADGGEVRLSQLRGKVVMLDFWATWCPPCVREMPMLLRVAQEYEGKGLVFLAASQDDPATAKADVELFIREVAPDLARHAVFPDDDAGDRYGVQVLPTLFFVSRDGELLESHPGEASERELRRWIERALSRPSVAR
jgi:thiol-disulfide isomerase/thioredoxin